MLSQEFVEPYRREIPEQELHCSLGAEFMGEIRYWDTAYGEVLHDTLAGKPVDVEQYKPNYWQFVERDLPKVMQNIEDADVQSRDRQRLMSETKFHSLNQAMYRMWFPLVGNHWKSEAGNDRLSTISLSQDHMAITGLVWYLMREGMAGKQADYAYFKKENDELQAFTEGLCNEQDASLVLMEAIKPFDDLTVVPGARQFESDGSQNTKFAADFVVVSQEGKAVGVQVKSNIVDQRTVAAYDKSRIMMIDGQRDLGNMRYLRTQQESTKMRQVNWAGLLCAQRVLGMRNHGSKSMSRFFGNARMIQSMQMQARQATRGMTSDFALATTIVRDRMVRHLQATPETRKPTVIDLAAQETAN